MPTGDPLPAFIKSIQDRAVRVKTAANALTDRIKQFETLLTHVPGRVEATVYGTWPDARSHDEKEYISLALWFRRQGNDWEIAWTRMDDRDDDGRIEWRPLLEAPLKVKLAAIKMFPNLLSAIQESQEKLITDLVAATLEYDNFVQVLIPQVPASAKGAK